MDEINYKHVAADLAQQLAEAIYQQVQWKVLAQTRTEECTSLRGQVDALSSGTRSPGTPEGT